MIHLLIIDAIRQMCEVMARVLSGEPDIEIVGAFTSISEALPCLEKADIVLVSAYLPEDAANQAFRAVERCVTQPLIVLMDWSEGQEALWHADSPNVAALVDVDDTVDDLLGKLRKVYHAATSPGPFLPAGLVPLATDSY